MSLSPEAVRRPFGAQQEQRLKRAAELQQQGAPQGPELDLRCLNHAAPRFRVNVLRDGRLLVDPNPRHASAPRPVS